MGGAMENEGAEGWGALGLNGQRSGMPGTDHEVDVDHCPDPLVGDGGPARESGSTCG